VTGSRGSRRDFLGHVAAAALAVRGFPAGPNAGDGHTNPPRPFRIRTITAGVALASPTDLAPVERAIASLERGRRAFESDGYEIQTLRVATSPLIAGLEPRARDAALPALLALDRLAQSRQVLVGIGPVLTQDRSDPALAAWAAELARATRNLSFTVTVADPERGAKPRAAQAAAEAITAIAQATPQGLGNFRFAAAACVPAGTPFFPVAYHAGPDALAVGVESASEVEAAFQGARGPDDAAARLRARLDEALAPVDRLAAAFAAGEGRVYLGIDPSPAPGKDRSIGAAIEALTRQPFGGASTLAACAAITASLKSLGVRTCGYAGLMLPVLEDPVLALRASERRFGVHDLLLYSSVCGTGLDVVPIPGALPAEAIARLVLDVAVLASRLRKPLSARLFPVPGKQAGEMARFDDPYLTDAAVMLVQ
jgi:uncharacterized protein (UPF0210 family)